MSVCDCLSMKSKPKRKNNAVSGSIDFNLSIATLQNATDILSEDDVLKIIGERVLNLIRTGV